MVTFLGHNVGGSIDLVGDGACPWDTMVWRVMMSLGHNDGRVENLMGDGDILGTHW